MIDHIMAFLYGAVLTVQITVLILLAVYVIISDQLMMRHYAPRWLRWTLILTLLAVLTGAAISLSNTVEGVSLPGVGVLVRTVFGTAVFICVVVSHFPIFWPEISRGSVIVRMIAKLTGGLLK